MPGISVTTAPAPAVPRVISSASHNVAARTTTRTRTGGKARPARIT